MIFNFLFYQFNYSLFLNVPGRVSVFSSAVLKPYHQYSMRTPISLPAWHLMELSFSTTRKTSKHQEPMGITNVELLDTLSQSVLRQENFLIPSTNKRDDADSPSTLSANQCSELLFLEHRQPISVTTWKLLHTVNQWGSYLEHLVHLAWIGAQYIQRYNYHSFIISFSSL